MKNRSISFFFLFLSLCNLGCNYQPNHQEQTNSIIQKANFLLFHANSDKIFVFMKSYETLNNKNYAALRGEIYKLDSLRSECFAIDKTAKQLKIKSKETIKLYNTFLGIKAESSNNMRLYTILNLLNKESETIDSLSSKMIIVDDSL